MSVRERLVGSATGRALVVAGTRGARGKRIRTGPQGCWPRGGVNATKFAIVKSSSDSNCRGFEVLLKA